MMEILRVFSVMIAILSLAACQEVVRPVDKNDITGIYYLLKVDDTALPGTVYHDDVALEIRSGTFIISADGTCFSRTRFTAPGGEEVTREVHAQYVVRDSRLIMTWEGAGMTEGTVEGDNFVMDNHGMIFEYTRNP
jgi:hypothetical protein